MPDNTLIPYTGVIESDSPDWQGKTYAPGLKPIVSAQYSVIQVGSVFFFERVLSDGENGSTTFFGVYTDSATANAMMNAQKTRDGFE